MLHARYAPARDNWVKKFGLVYHNCCSSVFSVPGTRLLLVQAEVGQAGQAGAQVLPRLLTRKPRAPAGAAWEAQTPGVERAVLTSA